MTQTQVRFADDPRLTQYALSDDGFTALVDGPTGSGKTLSLRPLIEYLGADNVLVIATDPRLAPLDGTGVRVFKAWMEPGLSEGAEMKAAASDAWQRLQGLHADLATAARNPKIVMPKVIVHDNLSNTGDILAYRIAPVNGQLSQPQWGELAREALRLVTFYRGLQVRGLVRIINCTSGYETDNLGRQVPVLFVGTGGKLAPRHIPRHIDYMFHMDTAYDPAAKGAGLDGMLRRFQTCEMNGVVAKGAPQLDTPFMVADWAEVYRRIIEKGGRHDGGA